MLNKYLRGGFIICYYILFSCFYLFNKCNVFLCICSFVICYILPCMFFLLPIILEKIFIKKSVLSTIFCYISLMFYVITVSLVSTYAINYLSEFNEDKWKNEKYHDFRYLMLDDLKNNYNFIGMSKKEVYNMLGSTIVNQEKYATELKMSYYMCYRITKRDRYNHIKVFCLQFDDNNLAVATSENEYLYYNNYPDFYGYD